MKHFPNLQFILIMFVYIIRVCMHVAVQGMQLGHKCHWLKILRSLDCALASFPDLFFLIIIRIGCTPTPP